MSLARAKLFVSCVAEADTKEKFLSYQIITMFAVTKRVEISVPSLPYVEITIGIQANPKRTDFMYFLATSSREATF